MLETDLSTQVNHKAFLLFELDDKSTDCGDDKGLIEVDGLLI